MRSWIFVEHLHGASAAQLGGIALFRVVGNGLSIESLFMTPLSVSACGRLQLGVSHNIT